jgi:predicted transcriptional regulator
MPRAKDPNAKRHQKQNTAFRIDNALKARLDAFVAAHHVRPTMTAVFEAALRDFLDKHEPEVRARKTM